LDKHQFGITSKRDPYFRNNGQQEELWSPEGYYWYGDKLLEHRPSQLTPEQQLEILDTHPLFTGKCPSGGHEFENYPPIHWDCPVCSWADEMLCDRWQYSLPLPTQGQGATCLINFSQKDLTFPN
jgi:hypothetical protein